MPAQTKTIAVLTKKARNNNMELPPPPPRLVMSGNTAEIRLALMLAAESGDDVVVKQLSPFCGFQWTQFAKADGSLFTVRLRV
tara:strand:- start:261 stop:509 length:249 start_codon:yes stop_codon:yes gene_type:complete